MLGVCGGFVVVQALYYAWYFAAKPGIAIPVFWLGMILIAVFALNAGWLPSGGFPQDGWGDPAEAFRALVLPVVTIALVMSASLIRYVRTATLDVLGSDYLRTARAHGSSNSTRHLPSASCSRASFALNVRPERPRNPGTGFAVLRVSISSLTTETGRILFAFFFQMTKPQPGSSFVQQE